jgi:hypothetical protein
MCSEVHKAYHPRWEGIEYIAEPVVTTNGAANRVKLNQLDASQRSEVPRFNEFSDVLPEELLGMPPDQDIEFVIELVPILLICIRDPIEWLLSN